MRIGIDCIKWDDQDIGGVNSYITGIVTALTQQTHHDIIIFCSPFNYDSIFKKFERQHVSILKILPDKKNILRSLSNKFIFRLYPNFKLWVFLMDFFDRKNRKLIDENCDILYCPRTLLSFHKLTVPTLLSMHDIQQVHFKDFFTRPEQINRRVLYGASAFKATYFQSSSNFIKNDLLNHFKNLRANQFVVIPEGVDVNSFARKPHINNVRKKYQLPEKFLFYPAQLWKHKNHINLLKALKKIQQEKHLEIPLVFTGKEYSAAEEIFRYVKSENLHFAHHLGLVDMEHLVELFHEAWYLVIPSLFESSSLPILEATAAGLPVIASNIEAIKEMNERFQMSLFDPNDVTSIADTIYKCWINTEERKKQIAFNKEMVRSNDWMEIGSQYIQFMEKAVNPSAYQSLKKNQVPDKKITQQ